MRCVQQCCDGSKPSTAHKLARGLTKVKKQARDELDGIAQEFDEELAEIHRRFGYQELLELLFMSLEREQMVTVAYDDAWLHTRMQKLDLSADKSVQELMEHACSWLWKDEEMHSIFVRGVLFQLAWEKRFRCMVLRIMQSYFEGIVGGWAGAVKNHLSWKRGHVVRCVAELTFCTGRMMGKVPREVGNHIGQSTFADFCRLQIEIERTATVGWSRALQVAKTLDDLPADWLPAFERISRDEANHMRIFKIFEDAFDGDVLKQGWNADRMAKELFKVGSYFVPIARRDALESREGASKLGRGGEVHVVTGQPGTEAAGAALLDVLSKVGLQRIVSERAKSEGVAISSMSVVIKTSFMLAYNRKDPSNYVEPVLVQSLVQQLRALGCKRVVVLETHGLYNNFHKHRSVQEVSEYIGLTPQNGEFEILSLDEDQVNYDYPRGLGVSTISRTWKEAHLRIVFAKMVSHPIDIAYLTLSGHVTLSGSVDDYLFVERRANRQAVKMMILDNFPAHLALVDAYNTAADGLVGMIACKRPLQPLRIYAGEDALAVDLVAARHLGIDPMTSQTLKSAKYWFGDPVLPVRVQGVDEPVHGWRGPLDNGYRAFCQLLANPSYELASGRGRLFLPPMDTKAFPPVAPTSCCFSGLQRVVRWLLGVPCW